MKTFIWSHSFSPVVVAVMAETVEEAQKKVLAYTGEEFHNLVGKEECLYVLDEASVFSFSRSNERYTSKYGYSQISPKNAPDFEIPVSVPPPDETDEDH